jgi:hypothetical protein
MIAIDAGTATLPFMNRIALIEAAVAARRPPPAARRSARGRRTRSSVAGRPVALRLAPNGDQPRACWPRSSVGADAETLNQAPFVAEIGTSAAHRSLNPARREQPELDGAWTYEFRGCLGDEAVRRTLRRRALAASLNANAEVPRPLDAPYRRVERPMTFLFRWRPLCLFPDSRRRNWYAQQTERGGFEPPMDRKAHTGFRDRRIQPLCHLSGGA